MKQKPYPAYKPSGVEWLGDVPAHWGVKHFRRIIKDIKDGTHGTFDRINDGKPLLSAKNVFEDGIHISENESLISEEDFESIINNGFPQKGDILLTIVGTIGRTFVFENDEPYAFQRSVCFIRLSVSNSPYYLKYFIQSKYFKEQLVTFSKVSAQGGVYMGDVMRNIVTVPSFPEQQAIATFLDQETGKIDALVAKKELLIERLREKRSALISHAVTKGLDPSVKMKPSGVEWLGDVPAHWGVKHFRRIIKDIKDGTHGTFDRINDGKPLLSAKNVFEDGIHISENESLISEEDFESIINNGFPQKGDILLTIVGTIGRTFVFENDEPYAFQRSVCFIRLSVSNSPYYLKYFIQSKYFKEQLVTFSKVSAQGGVYMGDVMRNIVTVPSFPEQQSIATFLDQETRKIDALIVKVGDAISKLKEYRTALISAAVTGKIDVREAA